MPEGDWMVTFDKAIFERSKQDKRFPSIVTLGRAVNALYVIHTTTLNPEIESPAQRRNKFNTFLFGSALMFECLNLIETMINDFSKDQRFNESLRPLLNDETSKRIKKAYLKGVRDQAVFHFDPKAFAKAISKTSFYTCSFVSGRGEPKHQLNYELADIVTAEILTGIPSDSPDFMPQLADAMSHTSTLINTFINVAEEFIVDHVQEWGYYQVPL